VPRAEKPSAQGLERGLKEHSGRVERLRSFVDRDPDNVDLAIDLVCSAAAEQGALDALDIEKTLNSTVVDHPEYANAIGLMLLEAGEPQHAEPYLQKVRATVSGNVGVNYNLAFALMQQHKFAEAIAEIDSAIDDWLQCTPLMLLKARCHHHVEELDAAEQSAVSFLGQHPDHLEATGLLSLILVDAGRYAEALELSSRVLAERPDQLEALLAQANASIASADYDGAGAALSAARERFPTIGRVQVLQGQLHLLQAQHDEALQAFRTATELMPQHIGSWHLLAWCQLLLNDIDSACESFASALAIDRNFSESHGGLAVAQFFQGQFPQAQESAELALRLDRHSLSGLYAQSLLDERAGSPGHAAKLIEKIFRTSVGQRAQQLMPAIAAHRAGQASAERKH